jgi:2-polyprenyl-3-methyl-5-hydroxy-6-metoxy-1,4-benzoquinol methylase
MINNPGNGSNHMSSLQSAITPERTFKGIHDIRICPLCGDPQISEFMTAPDRFHLRHEQYTLLRCSACSCVWLETPPKPEEMARHYSKDYHNIITTNAERTGAIRWQTHREIIAQHKQEGNILDVGCSSGSFLASMNNGKWKLYGIEMDGLMAEKARSNSGAEVFIGDLMDAPFPPNSFDVITAFDVLEHVYEPQEFLERVLYLLRPGGIFFAKLPNINSWEARLFGTYWYGLELPRHLYHFSPPSMKRLVANLNVRESYITANGQGAHFGHSVRYVYESIIQKFDLSPIPMAKARRSNLAWRAARKTFFFTLVAPMSRIASAANAGVVIDVILKK